MSINKTKIKKIISRVGLISVLVSLFLTACSTVGAIKNDLPWLPLALAIVLLIVFGVILGWLIKSGIFSTLSTAGINSNKWKVEERKLRGQKDDIQAKKENLISDLGKKAWAAKVMHPSYADSYSMLQDLDAQKTTLVKETQQLETALKQAEDSRTKITTEYTNQISDLQSLVKDVEKKLDKSRSQQSKLKKEVEKINREQDKLLGEVAENQEKLAEIEASDAPDKESQAEALVSRIKTLEDAINATREEIADIESDISKLEIEQQPFEDQIERLSAQISTVETNQQDALTPLAQRIADLEENLSSKKVEIEDLEEKMPPIIQNLSPLVEAARPESEALSGEYQKIDQASANLSDVTQEHHLITARLDTTDKGAVRNYYLMVAGLLVLVILIVVLFILAFV